MRLDKFSLVIATLAGAAIASNAQDVGKVDLNAPPAKLTARTRYFTVVASFETERGAMRRLNELRERTKPIDAVVFPPAGRQGKYWTVVVASFTDFESAAQRARRSAESTAAIDSYVIGMKAVEWGDHRFSVHPASVDLSDAVGLVAQGPPPTVLADKNQLILLSRYSDLATAEQAAALLEDRFQRLNLTILREQSAGYAIALATFVSASEAARAMEVAARMGLQTLEPVQLPVGVPPAWLIPPELADRRAEIARKVSSCYGTGLKLTAADLHACSGEWLTPPLLAQCVLESDCRGLARDVDVDAVLARYRLKRNSVLKMSIDGVPLGGDAAKVRDLLAKCNEQSKGDKVVFGICMSKGVVGPGAAEAFDCFSAAKNSADTSACVAKGAGIAPKQVDCLRQANGDSLAALKCVAPQEVGNATKIANCAGTAANDADVLRRCVLPSLPAEQRARAECLLKNGHSPTGVLSCVPASGSPQVKAAAACLASTDGSAAAMGRCLARRSGGDAAKVTACLGDDSVMPEHVAECVAPHDLNVQRAVRLATCAANYSSTAELLTSCSEGLVDPQVARIAGCAAAGDEKQVGACVAAQFLPPEAARLAACATGSQSATGVALCAVAPSLSEEWRIAAECAMTSGGVPVTFAACTAGRLTVRELTKCLTGQDCFGPNNEIVKAFNTVGNDLTHGLGEKHDLVVATKPIIEGVAHLSNEIAKGFQQGVGGLFKPVQDFFDRARRCWGWC